jgi:hypothetical protein
VTGEIEMPIPTSLHIMGVDVQYQAINDAFDKLTDGHPTWIDVDGVYHDPVGPKTCRYDEPSERRFNKSEFAAALLECGVEKAGESEFMRKPLVLANALLRDQRKWTEKGT